MSNRAKTSQSKKSSWGGARPNAGRKTKAERAYRDERVARAKKEAAKGPLPLDIMIAVMREKWDEGKKDEAFEHAKDCAQYFHPKMNSVDVSGELDSHTTHDFVDRPPGETREQFLARREKELNALVTTTRPAT